jgi:uncharacterized protein
MRAFILALTLIASPGLITAQETRTEVTRATTPEEDSKPNSDTVLDVQALVGNIDRVVLLRFKNQADILEGLQRMVKEQNIRNGVILAGIGSVQSYHYHIVSNRTFPSKNVFVKNPSASADIASMNGYVIDGKVHAHITMSNGDGAFGGHLEPGTTVFTFAVVTIGVLADGIDLKRIDDKNYR